MKIAGFFLFLVLLCPVGISQSLPVDSTPIEISFYGNQNFSNDELVENFKRSSNDIWKNYDEKAYEYFAQRYTRGLMHSKGFWRAKIVEITSTIRDGKRTVRIVVVEGQRYRIGTIRIDGNEAISSKEILEMYGQRTGEVADGKALQELAYERLKEKYGQLGYIQYNAEFEPEFIEPSAGRSDGVVNVSLRIDEGPQFKLRRIKITGIDAEEGEELVAHFPLKSGDVYVPRKLEEWASAINKSGRFAFLDKDKDVQILADGEAADIDLVISLKNAQP